MAEKGAISDEETYKQLTGSVFIGGAVSLALSMAKQMGIVDILVGASEPLSSQDIASQLKLKERYARELLSSLAAMRLIQVERGTGEKDGPAPRFFLPPQHRPAFQETAVFTQLSAAAASRFTDIRSIIPQDAPAHGMHYTSAEFCELSIIIDALKDILTKAILRTPGLKEQLEKGIQVLEIGCGTGNIACHLAAMFPKTKFLSTDLVPDGFEHARDAVRKSNLMNISFQVYDIFQIKEDWNDHFDWIFAVDVIHDLPYPLKALERIRDMLKPGCNFSMVEMLVSTYLSENIGSPFAAVLYALSTFLCIPASYQKLDSEALGACWGKQQAAELVKKAGLHFVDQIDSMPDSPGMFAVCMCQKPCD